MTRQIDSLTGVRGIAAMWVAFHHGNGYVSSDKVLPQAAVNFIEMGWVGVDLFFILSGLVISYVHQSDFVRLELEGYIRFLKLRLARIYPAHFIATIVLVPIVAGAFYFSIYDFSGGHAAQFSISRLVYSLTLLNGWGFPDSIGWNIPSWSVGSEWFAYLCFPFIAVAYNRMNSVWTHVGMVILVFSIMIVLAALLTNKQQYMLGHALMLTRVTSEFLIGCSLYNIYTRVKDHRVFDIIAISTSVMIIYLAAAKLPGFYDFLIIIAFAMLILSLSRSSGIAARLYSAPPLLYLGKVSYSIYLAHATVLMVVNQLLPRLLPQGMQESTYFFVFFLVFIPCAIVAGHILYTLVEQPARTYIRRRWVD